jgi:hypothetical protein
MLAEWRHGRGGNTLGETFVVDVGDVIDEDYLPLDGSGEEAEFTSRNQLWAVSPGA